MRSSEFYLDEIEMQLRPPASRQSTSITGGYNSSVQRISKRKSSFCNFIRVFWLVTFFLIVLSLVLFYRSYQFSIKENQTVGKLNVSDNISNSNINAKKSVPRNKTAVVAYKTLQNDCQSEACRNYSKILSRHMNAAADPCQDFHEYVCGHWNAHFDLNSSTHWEEIKINIFVVVDLALTEAMSDSNLVRNLLRKQQKLAKVVEYVVDLYREYLDEYSREQLGVQPLQQLLAQVFDTTEKWPLLSNESTSLPTFRASNGTLVPYFEISEFRSFWRSWSMNGFNNNIFMLQHLNTPTEIHQLLDCYVEASILGLYPLVSIVNRDKKTLKWKTNELILVPMNIQNDMTELYVKFRVLKHVSAVIFGHSYQNWNSSLDYAIYQVLDFYQAFSRLFPKTETESDSEAFQQPPKMKEITLGELKRRYSSPHFDWTLLLNKYASRTGASLRYTDRDTVRVQVDQLGLFKPFTNLLVKTPIRVLKNAMALQLVRAPSMIALLDEKNRELLNDNSTSGLIAKLFPGMNFVMKNFAAFGPIFIRLYVDYVGRQKMITARDRVSEMMRHLKDTFRDSLKEDHNWLDDRTRQNALEKLEAMRMMIAFPDWIFDDDVLDEEFGFSLNATVTKDSQNFINGHYATSFLAFRRLGVAAEFRKNDQILDSDREFLFFKSEAAYSVYFNLLGVSYALLSEPFFDVHYSVAINYGNLGSILAHEMTHAFDHDGRLFDKHGEMANWWTEHVSQHFEKLSKCFVHQYDGLVEPITGVKINGTATLGDNIADNGGLNQAYRAFEKMPNFFEDSDPFFPSHFTPEQLFFISYSINWCSEGEDTPEKSEFIRLDSHSPNKFRVNIPLANNVQFAEAFKCPVGSPMNPKFKCSVW